MGSVNSHYLRSRLVCLSAKLPPEGLAFALNTTGLALTVFIPICNRPRVNCKAMVLADARWPCAMMPISDVRLRRLYGEFQAGTHPLIELNVSASGAAVGGSKPSPAHFPHNDMDAIVPSPIRLRDFPLFDSGLRRIPGRVRSEVRPGDGKNRSNMAVLHAGRIALLNTWRLRIPPEKMYILPFLPAFRKSSIVSQA